MENNAFIIMGATGTGKTTLARKFPNPIVIATEPGWTGITGFIEPVDSYNSFVNFIKKLKENNSKNGKIIVKDKAGNETIFQTIIIDTIDALVDLCASQALVEFQAKDANLRHISDMSHGRGWFRVTEYLRNAIALVRSIPNTIHVWTAHTKTEERTTPVCEKYVYHSIDLSSKPAATVLNLADYTLHLDNIFVRGENQFVIYTQPTQYHQAKCRNDIIQMPAKMDNPKDSFILSKYFEIGG